MKLRYPCLFRPAALVALSLIFTGCGDDPELVSKREQQRAEIRKLEGELAILNERMEQIPPDRSAEVAQLKEDAEANAKEIAALEEEIQTLEKERAAIERDHEAYRRKYVVR